MDRPQKFSSTSRRQVFKSHWELDKDLVTNIIARENLPGVYPYRTASQHQYWARQIANLLSVLIQSYDHITFYNCQYKCKSWPRRASLNASLGRDVQV